MTMQLVLSLFPGIDLLGLAFNREGFCVVQGDDVIFGGDIRDEHYPVGKFDGVIGGPPCQMFSSLAHMVRHNGHQPKFGNLIPEFERVVLEAQPQWFAMEEVPGAPEPRVDGYGVHSFLINNRQFGEPQNRKRRWSFGTRGARRVLMVDVVALEHRDFEYAAIGGRSGLGHGRDPRRAAQLKKLHRKTSALRDFSRSQATYRKLLELQGLPESLDFPGFTIEGKCQAVANGVPLPMGRAIAKAIREATERGVAPDL